MTRNSSRNTRSTKYFPQVNQHEKSVQFKWDEVGDVINRKQYYRSCYVNGEKFEVGNDVLVRINEDEEAVANLLELFDDISFEENQHRALIKWYFTYSELPKTIKSRLGKNANDPGELYYPSDEYSAGKENIDAEVLLRRCDVIFKSCDFYPTVIDDDDNDNDEKFFVRYSFTASRLIDALSSQLTQPETSNTPSVKARSKSTTPSHLTRSGQPRTSRSARKSVQCDSTPSNQLLSKSTNQSKSTNKSRSKSASKSLTKSTKKKADVAACSSPKRKGSDSIYKNNDVPPAKVATPTTIPISKKKKEITPLDKWKRFDSLQASEMIFELDFDDDDASSTSSYQSTTSNRSRDRAPSNENRKPLKELEQNVRHTSKRNARPSTSKSSEYTSIVPKIDCKKTELPRPVISSVSTSDVVVALDNIQPPIPSRKTLVTKSAGPTTKQKTRSTRKSVVHFDEKNVEKDSTSSSLKTVTTKYGRKSIGVSRFDVDDNVNDADFKSTDDRKESSNDEDDDEISIKDFSDRELSSDDDFVERPTSARKSRRKRKTICMPKRKPSVKTPKSVPRLSRTQTPSSSRKSGVEMTPGISERKQPRLHAENPLQFARQSLHVSAVPDYLPCREEEFENIYSFVQFRLSSSTGGCMYISGVPGTGKTATVHEVVRTLEEQVDDGSLPPFRYFEINGMKLTDPNQAYSHLYKLMTGQKATPDHAASLLEKKFSEDTPKKPNVVLLVDELDLLWTRKQNVMYNLFDWPTRRFSKLVILAIANTMDLPERMMMNRVSSRLGLTRLTFQPYTYNQLEEIVLSRIKGIDAFKEDALQLVARKVASVSGDARRCLDICRRAVEIAETETASVLTSPSKRKKGIVVMTHVNSALEEMFTSPKILALQSLSLMEKVFIKALISELRRNGVEEAVFKDVYDQLKAHCCLEEGINAPSIAQCFNICDALGSTRIIFTEPGSKDILQKIRLNANIDDVMFAFKMKNR